ncbi:hypothetical protein ElyMa_002393800 [Elysia marginata]|uniref:Uncharacterized protein n=1 Tax=Elysia marginata TaxID=1093978 RepID=A0AAV4GDF5_9GAST|nr:hypothetical protein ElyMa_002393800 [Elysia marginata]
MPGLIRQYYGAYKSQRPQASSLRQWYSFTRPAWLHDCAKEKREKRDRVEWTSVDKSRLCGPQLAFSVSRSDVQGELIKLSSDDLCTALVPIFLPIILQFLMLMFYCLLCRETLEALETR